MVPFVILLFVVVAYSSNEVERKCSTQEYQRCISLAEPILKDPHLIYPDNTNDIESFCRTWLVFVSCMADHTQRCFTEARRREFNKAIESVDSSVDKLCSSREYRNDYLKHATCIKMILTQDTKCGLHYKLLVRKVSGETPLFAPPSRHVCCSHHLLKECVVHHAKRSCDPESAPYASSVFLREQCADYMAATKSNHSSTMSTSSLPTSTTPSSPPTTTTPSSPPTSTMPSRPDLWIPSMRPKQVIDHSIDEPKDPHGLSGSERPVNSGNQLTSPVLLLTTALMLLARGPALTR